MTLALITELIPGAGPPLTTIPKFFLSLSCSKDIIKPCKVTYVGVTSVVSLIHPEKKDFFRV